MAGRAAMKFFTQSCSYSLQTSIQSTAVATLSKKLPRRRPSRSYSQPPGHKAKAAERFIQLRQISKSLEHLRGQDDVPVEDHDPNTFPRATSMSFRDSAKEYKPEQVSESKQEDLSPAYEVVDGTRGKEHLYSVINEFREKETNKQMKLFLHLQPSNLKPFCSNENSLFPSSHRRKKKIVYPAMPATNIYPMSFGTKKEYPGYEDVKKVAVHEKSTPPSNKMRFSSASSKSKKSLDARKSSSALVKIRKKQTRRSHIETLLEASSKRLLGHFYKRMSNYNQAEDPKCREDFVKVKLGDLQEECRQEKRCKPRKIHFGRLPKLPPTDCPCVEDVPLKPGTPLPRLKKRFEVKEKPKVCVQVDKCAIPRADDHYQVKMKALPTLTMEDCPCEEREMTDFVIKRLPKKKIKEPPRSECCAKEKPCCPKRADHYLEVKQKRLPVYHPADCPCVPPPPMKDIPLARLRPNPVPEPKRVCPPRCEEHVPRADRFLKLEQKCLPPLKPDCVCTERPPMKDAPPIPRLKKVKIPEPVRCVKPVCPVVISRADDYLKLKGKKLPVFVPKSCPCVEGEVPAKSAPLKRLEKRFKPKEKRKMYMEESTCGERADDGMVIKPKQLPQIQVRECPCVEVELKDPPPLKKLVPKPVEEPIRKCVVEDECEISVRADVDLQVKKKSLPALPPGSCPCVESEPLKPGSPLVKLKKKPVSEPKKICEIIEDCPPRADKDLTVKMKELPKLEASDCPCKELEPPTEVKPLVRLKKVHVQEPPKICESIDPCEHSHRADEDDWLYWKRVEVKSGSCEPKKGSSTRNYSTIQKRYYSTDIVPLFNWNVTKCFLGRPYNVVITLKPPAPSLLDQPQPLSSDYVAMVVCKRLNRSISTCSTLCENSEKKETKSICACPKLTREQHLQPKNPIIASEKETFITPYPSDSLIQTSRLKSRLYERTASEEDLECADEEEIDPSQVKEEDEKTSVVEKLTLWQKIVNYFKARDCPSPDEFKKMRLKEAAEKAAAKAGLCLYDPKEMLKKAEEELPKVITARQDKK